MREVFYFGAGPAALPNSVLKKIQSEFLNHDKSGLSVLEISHRSEEFLSIKKGAEVLLRELLKIPGNYEILFMHGGATSQYSILPLNFLGGNKSADYICTGHWSVKAYKEAERLANVRKVDALENCDKLEIPPLNSLDLDPNSFYIHYCDNETVNGVKFSFIPELQGPNLVCDMTSSILSNPIDVNKFGIIYASAQKNLGIAGLCVVVIKKNIIENCNINVPRLYDYRQCCIENSLVNTPPIFQIYVLKLLLDWVKSEGGVEEMHKRCKVKSEMVYDVLDNSQLYVNNVCQVNRSAINVPFELKNPSLQSSFLQKASSSKLLGLKGHKSVGGLRVSFYNAMPKIGVNKLVEFMQEFEINNSSSIKD